MDALLLARWAVRLHGERAHHLPRVHQSVLRATSPFSRACGSGRGAASSSTSSTTGRRSSPSWFRHGRRVRHRDELPVRHNGPCSPTRSAPCSGRFIGYEVLSAFFLEAGFLGVMLFGMKRVGPGLHMLATLLVAAGTAMSAFWILSVKQLDADAHGLRDERRRSVRGRRLVGRDFQSSFPYRFAHMLIAAYLTTALVVAASARFICCATGATRRRARCSRWRCGWRPSPRGADRGGRPAWPQHLRASAREDCCDGRPLRDAGWRAADSSRHPEHAGMSAPITRSRSRSSAAIILTHELDGVVRGLEEWPPQDRPTH